MIPVIEREDTEQGDAGRVEEDRQLLLGYPSMRGEREKVVAILRGMSSVQRSLTYEWAPLTANPLGIIDHAYSITVGYHERDPRREDKLGLDSTWKELESIRRWFQLLQSGRPSVVLGQYVPEDGVGEPVEHLYWLAFDDSTDSFARSLVEHLDIEVRDYQLHVKYNDHDFNPLPTDDRSWRKFRKSHFWYSNRGQEEYDGPVTLGSFGTPPWPGLEG